VYPAQEANRRDPLASTQSILILYWQKTGTNCVAVCISRQESEKKYVVQADYKERRDDPGIESGQGVWLPHAAFNDAGELP